MSTPRSAGTTEARATSHQSPIRRMLAFVGFTALATAAIVQVSSSPANAISYSPTFSTVTSTGIPSSTGTVGTVNFTISTTNGMTNMNLASSAFVPSGPSLLAGFSVRSLNNVPVAFSGAVENPAFYLQDFPDAGSQPASYTLSSTGGSCTWSILSGLTGASLSGNTLTKAPAQSGPSNGILLCTGTVTGMTMETVGATSNTLFKVAIATLAEIVPTTTTTVPASEDPVAPTFTG